MCFPSSKNSFVFQSLLPAYPLAPVHLKSQNPVTKCDLIKNAALRAFKGAWDALRCARAAWQLNTINKLDTLQEN